MNLDISKPQKADFVVLGGASQGLLPILSRYSFCELDYRNSKLNLFALLHMFVHLGFSWRSYCISLLQLTQAQVVITCIDSDALFYSLKHSLPEVTFISIQNGIRGNITESPGGDLWTQLERLRHQPPHVDFVATFGPAHSKQYKNQIQCETLEIGSSRNNQFGVSRYTTPRTRPLIGFISNFIPPHCKVYSNVSSSPITTHLGSRPIPAHLYFHAEVVVGRIVAEICASEAWEFRVAGKRSDDVVGEREFWGEICRPRPYMFFPRDTKSSSYEILDDCDLIVTIDSTLGYEMIARGTRVIFISERARILGGDEARQFAFGFPDDFPDEGLFWTNSTDLRHVLSMMRRVLTMSDLEWDLCSEFVRERLMVFDAGNTLLHQLISNVATERALMPL